MSRTLQEAGNGFHEVVTTSKRRVFAATPSNHADEHGIIAQLNVETFEELQAARQDIGTWLERYGYPAEAATAEPPAFDPEYVAEALRSTLRATSFEGGVGEDLVEDFIASYEKAVEDGARA